MGNQLCHGRNSKSLKCPWRDRSQINGTGSGESWKYTSKKKHWKSCPSIFRRKKKTGNQARGTAKKQQEQQNGTKAHDNTEHTYERVLKQPVSQKRSQSCRSEESDLHYADIQVYSQSQLHSAWRAKPLKLENTTEYATLRFPLATPHQNSKKGTLV